MNRRTLLTAGLAPAICEVAGLAAPGYLQGRSTMPLIRGERTEIRGHLFGEVSYHVAQALVACRVPTLRDAWPSSQHSVLVREIPDKFAPGNGQPHSCAASTAAR